MKQFILALGIMASGAAFALVERPFSAKATTVCDQASGAAATRFHTGVSWLDGLKCLIPGRAATRSSSSIETIETDMQPPEALSADEPAMNNGFHVLHQFVR